MIFPFNTFVGDCLGGSCVIAGARIDLARPRSVDARTRTMEGRGWGNMRRPTPGCDRDRIAYEGGVIFQSEPGRSRGSRLGAAQRSALTTAMQPVVAER